MSAFNTIAQSKANLQVVYPLFRANLASLNLELIPVIQTWANAKFSELDGDNQKSIAAIIGKSGCQICRLLRQSQYQSRNCNRLL